jgi:methyl-accepting chemotaxis protein
MFNRLSIKLLLPQGLVGIIALLLVTVFTEEMSSAGVSGLLLVIIGLQLVASFLFSQQILDKRIEQLQHYLAKVVSLEDAPLSPLKDDSADELAKATNKLSDFIVGLSEVIKEIRHESESLRQGSGSLTSLISDSVESVDKSSDQIEQMATSIEKIASTSAILTENAVQVSDTTDQVISLLEQGTSSSNTSQKTIASFAEEVNGMAKDLALLQDECSRIGGVLDVIRGIADQTNLLALNAAIEAARAGEQGRGFAVVADEVRALAHRTQESTVEIQSMVEGLQEKSTNAVNAIGKGKSLSEDSLNQTEGVVEVLGQIAEAFTEVNNLTSLIADGTEEQQKSTASINDNMASFVSFSRDINQGLSAVAEHAEQQKATSEEVDTTLNKVCV